MEKHGMTWRRQRYGTLWWEFWNGKHDSSWGASFVKYNFTNFKLRHDRTTWRANSKRFALALILYLGYSTLYWHQVACCSWAIPSQAMGMTVVNCQAIYPPFILHVWWCPFWRVLIDQSRKVCLLVYGVALTAIYPLFILPYSVMLSFFRMHINQISYGMSSGILPWKGHSSWLCPSHEVTLHPTSRALQVYLLF